MNSCRVKRQDLFTFMDAADIDEHVKGLYVRISWETSTNSRKYRLTKIEKSMDFPSEYQFMNKPTTKGLSVSYGSKILTQKFNRVSDENVTKKEIDDWIRKMNKDKKQLPKIQQLQDKAVHLDAIRTAFESIPTTPTKPIYPTTPPKTKTKTKTKPKTKLSPNKLSPHQHHHQPGMAPPGFSSPINISPVGSPPHPHPLQHQRAEVSPQRNHIHSAPSFANHSHQGYAPPHIRNRAINNYGAPPPNSISLNEQNLQELDVQNMGNARQIYIQKYLDVINAGYNVFYCIPTSEGDSQYVAFLLAKTSSNEVILEEGKRLAVDIARTQHHEKI